MEQVMTRMPRGLKEILNTEAKTMGISLNALMLMQCWDALKKKPRNELKRILGEERLTELEIELYPVLKFRKGE